MTKSEIAQQALSLPFEDQLDLAQTLWENASPPPDFELSPELKELLEARLKEAQENPDGCPPPEQRSPIASGQGWQARPAS